MAMERKVEEGGKNEVFQGQGQDIRGEEGEGEKGKESKS